MTAPYEKKEPSYPVVPRIVSSVFSSAPTASVSAVGETVASSQVLSAPSAVFDPVGDLSWLSEFGSRVAKASTAARHSHLYADTGLFGIATGKSNAALALTAAAAAVDTFRVARDAGLSIEDIASTIREGVKEAYKDGAIEASKVLEPFIARLEKNAPGQGSILRLRSAGELLQLLQFILSLLLALYAMAHDRPAPPTTNVNVSVSVNTAARAGSIPDDGTLRSIVDQEIEKMRSADDDDPECK